MKSSAPENTEGCADVDAQTDRHVSPFLPGLSLCDDIELTVSESQALVFIAGYVGYKVVRKLTCDLCRGELVSEKTLQFDLSSADFTYLFELDRGVSSQMAN